MIDRVVYRREVLICLTSVFLFFLRADFLQGKSYAVGYNQYLAGDFVTAERSFRDALTNSGSTSEQSRIHKMLGITQYMQGKRVEAEKSFKRSKTLNPRIRISKDEVLDESIIDFFDGIQVRRVKPSAAPPTATKDSSLNKETYLRVVSNVRHARIVVDSRHRGGPGALIPVRPGIHEVEVYAKNYNRVGLPIEVLKGRVNDVTINLQKIKSELKTDSRSEISAAKDVKAKKKVKKRKKRKKRRLKRLPPKSTTKETGSEVTCAWKCTCPHEELACCSTSILVPVSSTKSQELLFRACRSCVPSMLKLALAIQESTFHQRQTDKSDSECSDWQISYGGTE